MCGAATPLGSVGARGCHACPEPNKSVYSSVNDPGDNRLEGHADMGCEMITP